MKAGIWILLTVVLAPMALGAGGAAYADHSAYSNMYNDDDYSDCSEGGETQQAGEHFCRTDNSTLTWGAQSSISASGVSNIAEVMEGTFENSDLSVQPREHPPVLEGTSETDIYFIQHDLPSALGTTWCNDAVDSERCDQHYIWTDASTVTKKVACHEGGHGVGLTHGSEGHGGTIPSDGADFLGCMQQPHEQIPNGSLGSHNVGEINDVY